MQNIVKDGDYTKRKIIYKNGGTQQYMQEFNVSSEVYLKSILQLFLPSFKFYYHRRQLGLLQDGARNHTSNDFIQNESIMIIQNLSWSPNLNRIEQIWAVMKKSCFKKYINKKLETRDDIINTIINAWNKIPHYVIINHIQNLKSVLIQVMKAKREILNNISYFQIPQYQQNDVLPTYYQYSGVNQSSEYIFVKSNLPNTKQN
ncbi:hypothetical protein ABPG74_019912 [Tetrahymena malaccensis]